jgi:membrane-bound lytic murein transglycosylase D
MDGLRYLYQTPGGLENADGRELYRSVVTAYEQYYGVSDTLSLQYSDIFAYRDEMFAEMNDVRAPLQREDVQLPPPGPVQTTIVLERNHLRGSSFRRR